MITRIVHRLIMARIARGWPRRELADALGMSYETIRAYEIGRRIPPADRLEDWADVLGLELTLIEKTEQAA